MKHIENLYIDEFRGYLKCLARLCANGYVFGVSCFEAEQGIDALAAELVEFWGQGDEFIKPSHYEYLGSSQINYDQFFQEIKSLSLIHI